jgi:hypothetical protein
VTLRGKGFSYAALGPVNFVIYNTTSTGAIDFWWTMSVVNLKNGVGPAVSNSTGEFYGYWEVLPATLLSIGTYKINATDATGKYMVQIPFSVEAAHVVATPRKATFKIGDTISFILEHSFKTNVMGSMLRIYNPSGALVFNGDALNTWTQTGLWFTAPYSSQTAGLNLMVIPDDAPLGTWSWKWVDAAGKTIKEGTFAVEASAVSDTDAKIQALTDKINTVTTTVNNLASTVATVATTATAASNAATAASTAASAAATAAQAATTAANDAGAKADAAKAAAESAAAAANGLTTLVYAAIGASLVAALAAIVALMQISRKIA